ncbi:MAG TPA: hypothetical protein VFI52_14685 [Gemmatimonadaceae bacterium]|nr:hypothetical protein [Gemmatimonadaceae bacterium]
MTTPKIRAFSALAALLVTGGCAQLRAANASPAPMEGQLSASLQQAEREVVSSRFGVADRMLADFALGHPNTPEAVETAYWRALFMLDPANQTASRRDAIAMLDSYLNAPVIVMHRGSAAALRRIAAALDRPVPVAAANPPSPAPSPRAEPKADTKAEDKSRDEEVQRLKEELAKANAELERIKKRVAQPNP